MTSFDVVDLEAVDHQVDAVLISAIERGNVVVLDPVWGREEVLGVREEQLGNGIESCLRIQLRPYKRHGASSRFVLRFPHEPALRMRTND